MENENSVCYVNRINKIEPIEGADKIELCFVNGWSSITQKGIHKVGELVVCITTDAVIPENLAYEFGIINYLRNKSRVRTVKLKGVYSECILVPQIKIKRTLNQGDDLMEFLNIYKYEPPVRQVNLAGGRKVKYKDNPNFKVYYKFPNQKNVPNMFNEEDYVVITRKMHGTNARYGIVKKHKLSIIDKIKKFFGNKWIEFEYVYGSHNVEKGSDSQGFYSTDIWKEIADKYSIKEKLWKLFKTIDSNEDIIIYGEIFGPGVQKNYDYNLSELKFEIFDIYVGYDYLGDLFYKGMIQELNIAGSVEELYQGKWSKEIQDRFVFNNYIENTKIPHEGVVVKCVSGDRKRVSKVINPDYLTYGEKHGTTDSH